MAQRWITLTSNLALEAASGSSYAFAVYRYKVMFVDSHSLFPVLSEPKHTTYALHHVLHPNNHLLLMLQLLVTKLRISASFRKMRSKLSVLWATSVSIYR